MTSKTLPCKQPLQYCLDNRSVNLFHDLASPRLAETICDRLPENDRVKRDLYNKTVVYRIVLAHEIRFVRGIYYYGDHPVLRSHNAAQSYLIHYKTLFAA